MIPQKIGPVWSAGILGIIVPSIFFCIAATAQNNPVPFVSQPLAPSAAAPGSATLVLKISGTGFVSGSVVQWNGHTLPTRFTSSTRLTARIPASDLALATTASVTVVNPGAGGGSSNVSFFQVATSTSSFSANTTTLSAANFPQAVITADFNSDGKLDLAYVAQTTTTVSIFLGNGDGTFQPAKNYAIGELPYDLVAADFNHDGKLDLAISENGSAGGHTVAILLGNGDGTFQPPKHFQTAQAPNRLAFGDFNSDGNLDLAVTANTDGGNNVSILLGNGDGTFKAPVFYTAGQSPLSVAAGDFNHDGKLDLAVANSSSNNVSILLGNGDGTFGSPVDYAVLTQPEWVTTADFNHDGKPDLAVANFFGSTISVLLGKGDGTFLPHVDYSVSGPTSVKIGDLNADGRLDLAVSDENSFAASVLLGNGDGTFQPQIILPAGTNPSSVAVGDFNGDGRLDLVVANYWNPGSLSIFIQTVP